MTNVRKQITSSFKIIFKHQIEWLSCKDKDQVLSSDEANPLAFIRLSILKCKSNVINIL